MLFPLVVTASQNALSFLAEFLWVHAIAGLPGEHLQLFAVFVTVGALMIALPYASFRRISLYFRGLIMASLAAMLSTSFAIPPQLRQLTGTSLRFLPSVWFLGLCQLIRGRARPSLAKLGGVALIASVGVIVVAVMIYVSCESLRPQISDQLATV